MLKLHSKLKYIIPCLFAFTVPLYSEELNNYVSSDIIVSIDKKNSNKKSIGVDWYGGHTDEFWYLNLGMQMREDIFDFAGNIGLQDSYFKNYPLQLGSTLEAYYHLRFIKAFKFEQDIFAAGSFFIDITPSNTRVTVYFGAGLKGNYLAVDNSNPPLWNVYPILSVYFTQKFSNFLILNAGVRSFSYFVSTAFIEPQFFINFDINLTPKLILKSGLEAKYNSYRKLEDVKNNPDSLEIQSLNFNAGVQYKF